jgi:transcriptional regulator with XRE-family HTH domain
MNAKSAYDDPAIVTVRGLWEANRADGWKQKRLGEAMGYKGDGARKSVKQFLKSRDPQISMLRRFADAVGVALSTIVRE